MNGAQRLATFLGICTALGGYPPTVPAAEQSPAGEAVRASALHYISTAFENASPLWWEADADGTVQVHLIYDHERSSPNRANGHWFFRVEAEPGADLTLVLGPFANVWNGVLSKPTPEATISFVSDDGQSWRAIPAEPAEPFRLKLRLHMQGPALYVARLPPYRLSDLEKLKAEIASHPLVTWTSIGRTVEGRDVDLVRVGKPEAAQDKVPHCVLLRARAHAWEPGGNWVVEGLLRRLLQNDDDARRYRDRYCVYVLPMANKDAVVHGRTRFNMQGMDLNRRWDKPADPVLAPENAALEGWLDQQLAQGRRPDLAIDFHNDASGLLHVSRPELATEKLKIYLSRMDRLEKLLREQTWFTEGSSKSTFRNPGSFGEGLLERYDIPACIHELNANRIAGLADHPTAEHWKKYGEQLAKVFFQYFE
jgi:hypothetical protein